MCKFWIGFQLLFCGLFPIHYLKAADFFRYLEVRRQNGPFHPGCPVQNLFYITVERQGYIIS